ncbi:MAG TPA: hypothetical protein EYO61_00945 [Campylobacterales bacterium]|nr:hypothetical protein [Campylobacterales bacterium]
MKKYIGYCIYTTLLFFGCSDNYDDSWKDKYVSNVDNINVGSSGESGIEENNNVNIDKVEISKTTEQKIDELKEKLDSASNDEIDEVVESVRNDIENSPDMSEEEKQEAINKINKLEKEKIKEGLENYFQQTDENINQNSCKEADNTGAIPPTIPPDECF